MLRQTVSICNKLGLHARAAAKLVTTAGGYESTISLIKDEQSVDAKSIMAIMMLAAPNGTNIDVMAEGTDEETAIQAVIGLINQRFGEDE